MTRHQIRTALAIVDDVHRIERATRPGQVVVLNAPLDLVIRVLADRMCRPSEKTPTRGRSNAQAAGLD